MAASRSQPGDSDAPKEPGESQAASEGVEHLQVAASEMLAAARSFLNAVDDIISDHEKLSAVASTVTDLLASAGSSLTSFADRATTESAGSSTDAAPDASAPKPPPRVRRVVVD